MMHQHVHSLFGACKPLIKKLGAQEYDYQFDPADLTVLPMCDQLRECLSTSESLDDLANLMELDNVYEYELLWFRAFSEMREILQQRASESITEPYYLFRQRLDSLERTVQDFLSTGIMRYRDDEEVLLVAEAARENPCYLSLAEKMLARIQAEVGGEPAPLWRRQDWILLYELRLQVLRWEDVVDAVICPSDYRKPSTVVGDEWLLARKSGYAFNEQDWKKGKEKGCIWLLFAAHEEVDIILENSSACHDRGKTRLGRQSFHGQD